MSEPSNVRDPGIAVLRPTGRLDASNLRELRSSLSASLQHPPARVLLDLAEVEFIDSTALGALALIARDVRAAAGEIAICGARENVRRVFEITQLHRVIDLFDDQESARLGLA